MSQTVSGYCLAPKYLLLHANCQAWVVTTSCLVNILTVIIIKVAVKRPQEGATGKIMLFLALPFDLATHMDCRLHSGSSILAKAISFRSLNMIGSSFILSGSVLQTARVYQPNAGKTFYSMHLTTAAIVSIRV